MKLSVFLNHVMEGAKQRGISLSKALNTAHGFGIDYLDADAREIAEIGSDAAEIISDSGMKVGVVNAFFDFGHSADKAGIENLGDTAAMLNAKTVMAIPGFVAKGESRDAQRVIMAKMLETTLDEMKKRSIALVLEDFDSDKAPYGGIDELKWFMDNVKGLSCAFDTGNFIYHADDVLKAYDVFRDKIAHVHLKDRGTDTRYGSAPLNCVDGRVLYPAAVGYGIIPIERILDRLFADNYHGIFTIEHFGAADQLEAMRLSAEWLRAYESKRH